MMQQVFIIAEAGVNHNGSVEIAKKLIDVAAKAKVDAIKFQTFKTELSITKDAKKADYQVANTQNSGESQFDMVKKLELSEDVHRELISYCKEKGVMFFSTAFDHHSINFLDSLGLDTFKIPSGEITNLPYLQHIGELRKKIILSTGMATLGEIENALNVLISSGTPRDNITILHANTEYPTPIEDVNLKAMLTIGQAFNTNYGYSDHTLGIEVPTAAVALGATVIEKHFTLDRNMEGPDHAASLEPSELYAMVSSIRNIEKALGSSIKQPSPSESKNIAVARKSIVTKTAVKKGQVFTESNLTTKRPAIGISPMDWDKVMGLVANRDYQPDELIDQQILIRSSYEY